MAKHYASCECASCEESRERLGAKLKQAVKRSIAYATYVAKCQLAQQEYKKAVAKAREEYEKTKMP